MAPARATPTVPEIRAPGESAAALKVHERDDLLYGRPGTMSADFTTWTCLLGHVTDRLHGGNLVRHALARYISGPPTRKRKASHLAVLVSRVLATATLAWLGCVSWHRRQEWLNLLGAASGPPASTRPRRKPGQAAELVSCCTHMPGTPPRSLRASHHPKTITRIYTVDRG
jgi:hypothetical protein